MNNHQDMIIVNLCFAEENLKEYEQGYNNNKIIVKRR